MKNKKISKFLNILVLLCIYLGFSSFSPSLDGRAVVVDDGVFPQGLFAKTVGYLPGDTISVTNIAGDKTIDILVIGALDASEGVAIMLSPEAATAIGINRDANNIVKITKRSGQDERVFGSAVIAKESDIGVNETPIEESAPSSEVVADTTKNEAETVSTNPVEQATETPVAVAETEAATQAVVAETPTEETAVAEEAISDAAVTEEVVDSNIEPLSDSADETKIEPKEVTEETIPENNITEEVVESDVNGLTDIQDEEKAELKEVTPDSIPEDVIGEEFVETDLEDLPQTTSEKPLESVIEETVVPDENKTEESVEADEFIEEKPVDEETVADTNLADDSEEIIAEETVVPEEAIAEESVESDELAEIKPEESVEEKTDILDEGITTEDFASNDDSDEVESVEENEEEYQAIVLVPVDQNPPEEAISVEETVTIEDNAKTESSADAEKTCIDVNVKIEVTPSYEKYVVPSLNDLQKGSYYLQIASVTKDESVMDIINKYGNNYPIVLVPSKTGNTKQIMIGPMNIDEYGAVTERFKSYGYKDCFIRKIR